MSISKLVATCKYTIFAIKKAKIAKNILDKKASTTGTFAFAPAL